MWDSLVPGEGFREGKHENLINTCDKVFDDGVSCLMSKIMGVDLARPAPPSVGGGLKAPKGGHRRLPHFGEAFEEAKAEQERTPGKRLCHICQVVLLNVGSILVTKGRQEACRLHNQAWRLQN